MNSRARSGVGHSSRDLGHQGLSGILLGAVLRTLGLGALCMGFWDLLGILGTLPKLFGDILGLGM